MSETELGEILKLIDAAVEVYLQHEGPLRGPEISVKSMLMARRAQVADQLSRKESVAAGPATAVYGKV